MDGPVKAKTRQSGRTGCKPVPRAWAGLQAQPRRDLQIAQPSRPRALLDPGKPVTQGEQESHDTQPDEVNDPKIVAVVLRYVLRSEACEQPIDPTVAQPGEAEEQALDH